MNIGTWSFRDLSVSLIGKQYFGPGDFRPTAGLGLWAVVAPPRESGDQTAIAILARAFDYNIGARTYRRTLKFQRRDYFVMAVIVGLLLGSMALEHYGLGNPTEQVILGMIGR